LFVLSLSLFPLGKHIFTSSYSNHIFSLFLRIPHSNSWLLLTPKRIGSSPSFLLIAAWQIGTRAESKLSCHPRGSLRSLFHSKFSRCAFPGVTLMSERMAIVPSDDMERLAKKFSISVNLFVEGASDETYLFRQWDESTSELRCQ